MTGLILNFRGAYVPPASNAVPIHFQPDSTNAAAAAFSTTLRRPVCSIDLYSLKLAAFSTTLRRVGCALEADWDNNVWRGLTGDTNGTWQPAAEATQRAAGTYHDTGPLRSPVLAPWGAASDLTSGQGGNYQESAPLRSTTRADWSGCTTARSLPGGAYHDDLPRFHAAGDRWHEARNPGNNGAGGRYHDTFRIDDFLRAPWASTRTVNKTWGGDQQAARTVLLQWRLPWQDTGLAPYGVHPGPTEPPEPGWAYEPPDGHHVIIEFLHRLKTGPLIILFSRYGIGESKLTIPIRSAYIVLNTATLVRLPERTVIPTSQIGVSIDMDSWAWSLRATLTGSASAALLASTGDPVEVEATINGKVWTALIDELSISRAFASNSYSVTGRSRAAYLADPYAPIVTRYQNSVRTAQQLADEALADTGWSLAWSAPDWTVPGGVWSQQGTIIEALSRITEAAGGFINAHRYSNSLIVAPRYAALPWEWNDTSPDVTVPASVLLKLGWRPVTQPDYTAVYVSGQSQGVLARVLKAGTAGDVVAPLITDPLCTHADMARARGGALLARTGRMAEVSLELPLQSPSIPLLAVGQLLRVQDGADDWRGLVTGISIDAARDADKLTIRQTATVERHYA